MSINNLKYHQYLLKTIVLLLFLPIICFSQSKQKQRFVPFKNKEVKNSELIEVLALGNLEAAVDINYYACRLFSVCNGPPDQQAEYCNCSFNYYISILTTELPTYYKLFKVGPFYEVSATNLEKGIDENTFTLLIQHEQDGKKLENKFLVSFKKVTVVK